MPRPAKPLSARADGAESVFFLRGGAPCGILTLDRAENAKETGDVRVKWFDRFRKKRAERNEIGNTERKEALANAALAMLSGDGDNENAGPVQVEFGYLFDIERHGTEALFKVSSPVSTAYFAVQGNQLIRLDLSEELFRDTAAAFLEMHG